MKWKDCYIIRKGPEVFIGNSRIERRMAHYGLATTAIEDKASGYVYQNDRDDTLIMKSVPFDVRSVQVACEEYVSDEGGLSEESLRLRLTFRHEEDAYIREYIVYPNLPYIQHKAHIAGRTSPLSGWKEEGPFDGVESGYFLDRADAVVFSEPDAVDCFALPEGHFTLRSMSFFDQTDQNDFLVKETFQTLYRNGVCRVEGSLFTLCDTFARQSLLIMRDAPLRSAALNRGDCDLAVSRARGTTQIQVMGSGVDLSQPASEALPLYGAGIAVCAQGEEDALYRAIYRAQYKGQSDGRTFVMSNTWGDRSQDAAVCHEFMMREAAVAAEIGVDIVQIDDGWEKGITSNSKRQSGGVWEGYYAFDRQFWDVGGAKFPQGLGPLEKTLSSSGMRLGLWFSPDSSGSFSNWEKDVETLLSLHEKEHASFFKLDGVKIRDKLSEKRYLSFLRALAERSRNAISFNQDITAEQRLGYFYEKQFGTLFVENRYTDWGNYYPHNTLKNLWMLSRYIPANKFQFELLNLRRNRHKYAGDPLAPEHYDIGYAFACVMLANPLVWMEMTALADEDIAILRHAISVYRRHREAFFAADISPIGLRPDGQSFTGFHIRVNTGSGYLLLFREMTEGNAFDYHVPALAGKKLVTEVLLSNAAASDIVMPDTVGVEDGEMSVTIKKQRGYALVQYTID